MARLHEKIFRKLMKPFYAPYYRLVYGRGFPGSGALEQLVVYYESLSERGDVPLPQGDWEQQYDAGQWDFLAGEEERERYRELALILEEQLPQGGRLLDVGCGEGLLLDVLPKKRYPYTGIDLSQVAIDRARERFAGRSEAHFMAADAETWEPAGDDQGPYDAIVLNECLYYFRRPLEQMERYLGWLTPSSPGGAAVDPTPGGVLLLSMFRTPRSQALARLACTRWVLVGNIEIQGEKGSWWIGIFIP